MCVGRQEGAILQYEDGQTLGGAVGGVLAPGPTLAGHLRLVVGQLPEKGEIRPDEGPHRADVAESGRQ